MLKRKYFFLTGLMIVALIASSLVGCSSSSSVSSNSSNNQSSASINSAEAPTNDWKSDAILLGSLPIVLGKTTASELIESSEWTVDPTSLERYAEDGLTLEPGAFHSFYFKDASLDVDDYSAVEVRVKNAQGTKENAENCPIVGIFIYSGAPDEAYGNISVNGVKIGDDLTIAEQIFGTKREPDSRGEVVSILSDNVHLSLLGNSSGVIEEITLALEENSD